METNEQAKAKGGKRRRAPIVCAVVAVVLVCAGGGFYVWHNQPSFCNAICHEPMDYYVDGYYGEGDAAHAQLAVAHQQEGVTCLQCHEATLEAQVNEGTAWVSGAFETNADGSLAQMCIRDRGHASPGQRPMFHCRLRNRQLRLVQRPGSCVQPAG